MAPCRTSRWQRAVAPVSAAVAVAVLGAGTGYVVGRSGGGRRVLSSVGVPVAPSTVAASCGPVRPASAQADVSAAMLPAPPGATADGDPAQGYLLTGPYVPASALGVVRRVWDEGSLGLLVDVRIVSFPCAGAASRSVTAGANDHLATVDPVPVPVTVAADPSARVTGWASSGSNVDGAYTQATAAASGRYEAEVVVTSARPGNGRYAAALVAAQALDLQAWEADGAPTSVGVTPSLDPLLGTIGKGLPTPCPAPTGATPNLDVLMAPPPPGFNPVPDGQGDSGPFGVSDLASVSPVPALAAARYRAEGVEGGLRQVYERDDLGAQLQVAVTAFTCPAGAAAEHSVPPAGVSSVMFPVTDGVPGALGAISTEPDGLGHYEEAIDATVGSVDLRVEWFSPSTDTSELQAFTAVAAATISTADP